MKNFLIKLIICRFDHGYKLSVTKCRDTKCRGYKVSRLQSVGYKMSVIGN